MIDKLIEDVMTLNPSTIRNRLISLREQAEALDSQFHSMELRLAELKSERQKEEGEPQQQPLGKDADRLIALLFERTGSGSGIEFIARTLGISQGMADHYVNVLEQKELIRWMGFETEGTKTQRSLSSINAAYANL